MKSSPHHYGILSKVFHWLTAVLVIGLFILGFWMIDLTYYSEWYQTAPFLHESFGILLVLVLAMRLFWQQVDNKPAPLSTHSPLEKLVALWIKRLLWFLMISICISGFLISTADFRPINVFGVLELPPLFDGLEDQAKVSGFLHKWMAYLLMLCVLLHAAGALKHHFVDKDETLKRMLYPIKSQDKE